MSAVATTEGAADDAAPSGKSGKTKKLLLVALLLVALAALGAAAWFTGLIWMVPGLKRPAVEMTGPVAMPPVYVELPQIVANLNAGPRRTSFVKLQARLELARAEDLPIFVAAQPRVMDLFQTYLREMRPDELRGSMGSYRLREQLIARASLAAAPARIVDVLFTELLVQ